MTASCENGVQCPECKSCKTAVKDSRPTKDSLHRGAIYRRRMCLKCKMRFTTCEIVVMKDFGHSRNRGWTALHSALKELTLRVNQLESLDRDIDAVKM